MSDLNEIVPVENADARRDMLSKQFDEAIEDASPVVEKPRDEIGRFAKSDKSNNEEKVEKAEKVVAAKGAVTNDALVEEPVWKKPPASWKKDYHDAWGAADDRMKEYAYKREEEMKAGLQPFMEKARFADAMHAVIEPHMNTINGLGIDPADAVRGLLEADHALRHSSPAEKQQYLFRLAQNYGVDLSGANLPQQAVDPTIYALQNELNKIRGEVVGWKNQQEQQQNQSLLHEIDNFSKKVEYFDEVRPAMIQLLQGGMAATLEEAYDKAVRLTPEIFDALQQSKQADAEAEKRAAANNAAKKARAAAVSVKGSTPGTATTSNAKDRRSMLSEQFEQMAERL